MTPIEPPKNAMGTNTAASTSAMRDQRAGDLVHRLARGLARRQAFLGHHALDVFHHHDGVVHQQADRQRHAEHGQRVDREAEGREDAERAEQHHRHGDRRDQRGAHVLQEQVHHQEHQHDRLEQRLHHFLDRGAHERRRVERIDDLEAAREERRQPVERRVDAVDGVERVRPAASRMATPAAGLPLYLVSRM